MASPASQSWFILPAKTREKTRKKGEACLGGWWKLNSLSRFGWIKESYESVGAQE